MEAIFHNTLAKPGRGFRMDLTPEITDGGAKVVFPAGTYEFEGKAYVLDDDVEHVYGAPRPKTSAIKCFLVWDPQAEEANILVDHYSAGELQYDWRLSSLEMVHQVATIRVPALSANLLGSGVRLNVFHVMEEGLNA